MVKRNHVYVLDEELEIVGKIEDLAKGEKIYSARFMGERADYIEERAYHTDSKDAIFKAEEKKYRLHKDK